MTRSGADLVLLLLGGFRSLVDAAVLELAERGYPDFRPAHEFAMRAIVAGADNASELGRRTAVSKQAASKTISILVERGYVEIGTDQSDGRRKRLQVTELGFAAMREGEQVFEELRDQWIAQIGLEQVEHLEATLTTLTAGASASATDTLP